MKKATGIWIIVYGFTILGICIAIRITLFTRNQETPDSLFEFWNWGLMFLAIGGLYLTDKKEK